MGKPYEAELGRLPETFEWARTLDLAEVQTALTPLRQNPCLIIGSGGSLSVAHFAASLWETQTGLFAKACTPMEFAASAPRLEQFSVLVLSAGGRNRDILHAYQNAVLQEAAWTTVICGTPGSPLSRLALQNEFSSIAEFRCPSGKDGFLATNSLLAFAVILYRAFCDPSDTSLPQWCELLKVPDLATFFTAVGEGDCEGLVQRKTLIVLHGPELKPAAVDIESKLTEAALAHAQVTDYRNFGHGRHYWLASVMSPK